MVYRYRTKYVHISLYLMLIRCAKWIPKQFSYPSLDINTSCFQFHTVILSINMWSHEVGFRHVQQLSVCHFHTSDQRVQPVHISHSYCTGSGVLTRYTHSKQCNIKILHCYQCIYLVTPFLKVLKIIRFLWCNPLLSVSLYKMLSLNLIVGFYYCWSI